MIICRHHLSNQTLDWPEVQWFIRSGRHQTLSIYRRGKKRTTSGQSWHSTWWKALHPRRDLRYDSGQDARYCCEFFAIAMETEIANLFSLLVSKGIYERKWLTRSSPFPLISTTLNDRQRKTPVRSSDWMSFASSMNRRPRPLLTVWIDWKRKAKRTS